MFDTEQGSMTTVLFQNGIGRQWVANRNTWYSPKWTEWRRSLAEPVVIVAMEKRFHGGIWHGYHRGGTGKFWVYVRVSQAYAQRGNR